MQEGRRGNEESGALCNCQSASARWFGKIYGGTEKEREGRRRRRRFTHVPEEFSDAQGRGPPPRPVYNIMQQFRNNVRLPGLATLLAGALFYQRYSSSINSFLPLPPRRPSSRRALFRARFMKWYFVQFHFSIRLDLLSPG